MKKIFIPLLFILVTVVSCNNFNVCQDSSDSAFEAFKTNVENKDFNKTKKILANDRSDHFEQHLDTIFKILKKPSLEFIPEKEDGAFGIKRQRNADMFYAYLKEENKIFSIIAVMFSNNINCYEIINIVSVKTTNDNFIPKEELFDKSKFTKPNQTKSDLNIKPNIIEPNPSNEEQYVYDKAYYLWFNSKSQEAIEQLRRFIEKYPKSSLADDAQDMIGTSYSNLANYEQAIIEYKKVAINYPQSNSAPISLYNIAHLYFYSLNDFVNAKLYYQDFINSATKENIKFRDIALKKLKNWDKETKTYSGYANRKKSGSYKSIRNESQDKDNIIAKLKLKAQKDWPNDYTTQEYWLNEQIMAYEYMLTVENNSVKNQAQKDWPLDFSTQKYWYNEQIRAKERIK